MVDMWTGAAILIVVLLLPIILPIVYYFIDRESFRKHAIWIWLGAGVIELILLFLAAMLVI